jgi:tetratricopeptide (TPR) repeat protein
MAEKSVNEVSRPLKEQYEKGVMALQRQNYDYAISILSQVLQKEPSFFECRQALRATQFKKAGASAGFFKRMLGSASSSPLVAKAQMALRSNPLEALEIAEQILSSEPSSTSAHKIVAEAAMAAGFPKSAILSLEILIKGAPRDRDLVMQLGQAYAQVGQITRAEDLYADLLRTRPHDSELAQALKNLSARKTLSEGGYDALADGSGSYRDILKNKDEAVSLEQEHREVKSEVVAERLIREYETRLSSEPGNIKLLRSIAELCAQKKEFDRSLSYYKQILAIAGATDPSLEKAIAETTVRRFDHALSQLDPNAADYPEQSARIKAERDAYLLEECKSRAERYPTDLQIRFELGLLYFKAGKIGEAIQELQKAQANPHRRVQALSYLGQCFARRGMYDLAAKTLQTAIAEKQVFDDDKKELIYLLGTVFEGMGKAEEAIEQYKQIYEVDIGYRDISAKVDAYYASR